MTAPATDGPLFLGFPPETASKQYLGRITWIHPDRTLPLIQGAILVGGAAFYWAAHEHAGAKHLLQLVGHWAVFTGHNIGGVFYLTGVRPAHGAEAADLTHTSHSDRGK